jgi:hypothetical protein
MLGVQKTRKKFMKALALTTPSQLSVHFVVYNLRRRIKSEYTQFPDVRLNLINSSRTVI